MISLERWIILTSLQKLSSNVGDLGKIIVANGFEWSLKVQKIAQSGHTGHKSNGQSYKHSKIIIYLQLLLIHADWKIAKDNKTFITYNHWAATYIFFMLPRPSQDVFLLTLIPWIEQGGSTHFLLHYSMIRVMASPFLS